MNNSKELNALIDMAVESWRFSRVFVRMLARARVVAVRQRCFEPCSATSLKSSGARRTPGRSSRCRQRSQMQKDATLQSAELAELGKVALM